MISIVKICLLLTALGTLCSSAFAGAKYEQTEYKEEQKVVFDFFFDHPEKAASALFWLRAYINPLQDDPYGYEPEFMDIKVIIHGTEIVTLAKKNYDKYQNIVERMKYYHALGVEFRVCAIAAEDYGYSADDFQDFVIMAPSAIVELGHWQQEGYALIQPVVFSRTSSIDEIR
jgi:intracellular sulfur oxidation DsrE/DsrF family protein